MSCGHLPTFAADVQLNSAKKLDGVVDQSFRLTDSPTKFTPVNARSASDLDKLESAALFAYGRLLYQQQDYLGALRRYQRAFRLNPRAQSVLVEIVELATFVQRPAIAARYAVLEDSGPMDPTLLRQLAVFMTEQDHYGSAIRLYELAIGQQQRESDPNIVFAQFELGRLYFVHGQLENAAEAFSVVRDAITRPERFGLDKSLRELLLSTPNVTYSIMAESFLQANRPQVALSLFEKVDRIRKNDALLSFHHARVKAKLGHIDSAIENLNQYLDKGLTVGGSEPYELLSELLVKKYGETEGPTRLRKRIGSLYESNSDNTPLAYFHAGLHFGADDLDSAELIYADLANKAPTLDGLGALASIYAEQHRLRELFEVLTTVTTHTPDFRALQTIITRIGENSTFVNELLEKSNEFTADAPSRDAAELTTAFLRLHAGDAEVANQAFNRSTAKSNETKLMSWGLELFMAEHFAIASQVFQRAVGIANQAQTKAIFFFYLAGSLAMEEKAEEALAAIDAALKLNDSSAMFLSRKAWILHLAGRVNDARQQYADLVEAYDANHASLETRELLREARSSLSNICVLQGELDKSEDWLEQNLDEFPSDTGTLNDLGYLWADQNKNLHRALPMIRTAVSRDPENIAYRDSLGWVLYRLGHFEEAVRELRKAVEADKPDGIILDHLGDAYAKLEKKAEALANWRHAVDAMDENVESDRVKTIQDKIDKTIAE